MQRCGRRDAFTLVELLVVMALIILLAAITALSMGFFRDDKRKADAVDRLSQWLLTAKQRAKRDGLPTGLRFIVNAQGISSQCQFIQQPDDLTGDPAAGRTCSTASSDPSFSTFSFTSSSGVDFTNGANTGQYDQYLVQPGDYFELYGGGNIHLILDVALNTTTNPPTSTITLASPATAAVSATANYRIRRQPRPILGEETLSMPQGMVVDINNLSRNVSRRSIGGPNTPPVAVYQEVLFAPTGAVIGLGTGGGQVYLWVMDGDPDTNPQQNGLAIVAIQARAGFISAHPIAPWDRTQPISQQNDPYRFSYDARSSGL